MLVNTFLAATPASWLTLIFGVGYGSGLLLYIMIQFDLEYEHRNHRDWHYTTWLIALPAVIGVNQRFHPKHSAIRLYYGLMLLVMMVVWQSLFWYGFPFFQDPTQFAQTATVDEIVEDEFRLVGSTEVLSLISHDSRVSLCFTEFCSL